MNPTAPAAIARPSAAVPELLRVLASRLVLFAAAQALVALGFAVSGAPATWDASIAWWPVGVVVANLASVGLLARGMAREGSSLRALYLPAGGRVGRDLLALLGVLVLTGPIGHLPNVLLATALWGDPAAPLAIFVRPLPAWAGVVALVGFPLTIALSELPTYYGYLLPRLEAAWGSRGKALAATAAAHALQHVTLPLVLDARFLLWRGLMFLPFAAFVGAAIRWRPTLLPYLMVVHMLIDAMVGAMVYAAAG